QRRPLPSDAARKVVVAAGAGVVLKEEPVVHDLAEHDLVSALAQPCQRRLVDRRPKPRPAVLLVMRERRFEPHQRAAAACCSGFFGFGLAASSALRWAMCSSIQIVIGEAMYQVEYVPEMMPTSIARAKSWMVPTP